MFLHFILATILLSYVLCNVHSSRLKMDSSSVENKNHLMEHVDYVDVASMSVEELRLLYFKTHDTDGDNRLDGLELIQAILHFHDDTLSISPVGYCFTDAELESFVDPVFEESDVNNDGFLDSAEFLTLRFAKSDV